jgi:osmotically-inducible protein OsmY
LGSHSSPAYQANDDVIVMSGSTGTGSILAILLASSLLGATLLHAEESTPQTQEIKPPLPKAQEQKTQEPKNPEPHPPELKQAPKLKESTHEQAPSKPGRSLILTVKLALMADQRTAPYRIEVETEGQDVVLSGKVSSTVEKLAATEVAQQVKGIKSVVNKLEVVPELHKDMKQKRDQIITEYVRERFKKSATLEAAGFDIKTNDGVVELSGKTRFQVIVLEAAEAARQIPGVKAVKTQAVLIDSAD